MQADGRQGHIRMLLVTNSQAWIRAIFQVIHANETLACRFRLTGYNLLIHIESGMGTALVRRKSVTDCALFLKIELCAMLTQRH